MSLWNKLELFSAADAASLAIGDDESETKALLNQMRDAYEKAVGETFSKHFEITYPDSQVNTKQVRYHSITDPLPEGLFYSRALDMHARLLFRPHPNEVSCKFFREWYSNHTDRDYAFSCNFDVQKFDRNELQRWLAFHEIESAYQFKKVTPSTKDDSPVQQPIDIKLLANPEELLKAFGVWGLKKTWFNCLGNHAWLLEARRRIGVGGNNFKPPLFCPLRVLIGLATQTKPRRGDRPRVSFEKGWKHLKINFPLVCQENAHLAPDDDQG